MVPNKFLTLIVFIFLFYSIFNEMRTKTGSYLPKVPVPSEVFAKNKDNGFVSKAINLLTYPYDNREECGIGKDKLFSQPIISGSFKIFETKSGENKLKCGDNVTIDYKLYSLDGVMLYDSKEKNQAKSFKIGDVNIPYGFNKALLYSSRHALLTIISPAIYLHKNILLEPLNNFFALELPIKGNEMMMVDLEIR